LYGCETWSITQREGHRLRAFENRELRRIFGPKRKEMAGEWRGVHNEELHNLYALPNNMRLIKSRRMRWARHVVGTGGEEIERGEIGTKFLSENTEERTTRKT